MRLTKEAIAEIRALEDKQGRLTPQQVVEAARSKTSALHGCFEWDDEKAGASYRIEQARELLRRVKIVIEVDERTIRTVGYVRDTTAGQNEPGYRATLKVRGQAAVDMIRTELEAVGADLSRVVGLATVQASELPDKVPEKITGIKAQVDRLAASL